jgi:hypothetical protein
VLPFPTMSSPPNPMPDVPVTTADRAAAAHRRTVAELQSLFRDALFMQYSNTGTRSNANVPRPGSLAFDTEPLPDWPSLSGADLLPPIGTGRPAREPRKSSPASAPVIALPGLDVANTEPIVGWPPNVLPPIGTGRPAQEPRISSSAPATVVARPHNTSSEDHEPSTQYGHIDNMIGNSTTSSQGSSRSERPSGALRTTFSDFELPIPYGRLDSIMNDTATFPQSQSPPLLLSRITSRFAEDNADWVRTQQSLYTRLAQLESPRPAPGPSTPSEASWVSANDSGYDPDIDQFGSDSFNDSRWDSEDEEEFVVVESEDDSDDAWEDSDDSNAPSEYGGYILL